jgi:DNA modification methylase
VFLLSKAARYYYDADAIRQPLAESSVQRFAQDIEAQAGSERAHGGEKIMKAVCKGDKQRGHSRRHDGFNDRWDSVTKAEQMACGSNARDVWTIATQPFSGAHFATMPPELAERCIKAGTRPGDTVLDPFGGAGTTGLAADRLNRDAVLIELNPDYAALAKARVTDDCPMFAEVVA